MAFTNCIFRRLVPAARVLMAVTAVALIARPADAQSSDGIVGQAPPLALEDSPADGDNEAGTDGTGASTSLLQLPRPVTDVELFDRGSLGTSARPSTRSRSESLAATRSRTRQRSRFSSVATSGAVASLATIPFMIGDTGSGTCFSQRGIVNADIGHPTLTCSRLNISENNTALPVDRIYYSYRHFRNSTNLKVYQFEEVYDLDRHMLGYERTFCDGIGSVEVRLPTEYRLRSDFISIVDEVTGIADLVAGEEREVGLGNVAIITKLLLHHSEQVVFTGGLGVTLPTAEDVRYRLGARTTVASDLIPGLFARTTSVFDYSYSNETVYLSPFAAWIMRPQARDSRWYHQGFLQVEVAANPSTLSAVGSGATDFTFNGVDAGFLDFNTPNNQPAEVDVFAQTLLRVNLGVGYRLTDRDTSRPVSNIRSLFELHYTTTLQRANTSFIPLEQVGAGAGTVFPQFSSVGNGDPRTDILNAAAGFSADVGRVTITNGVIAPLRSGPDRGFDFEYNVQVQCLL